MKTMKKKIIFLIFIFIFSEFGWTQTEVLAQNKRTSKTAATARRARKVKTRYDSVHVGAVLWQENITAQRASEKSGMPFQFHGIKVGYNYQKFRLRSRFRQYHSADVGFGFTKGKGQTVTIGDELKNQMWATATFAPGFMYRTSPYSDIGLQVPLVYRLIDWQLATNSGLTLREKSAFSAGLGLLYINRFSRKNSIQFLVTYQHLWQTTQWMMAWEHYL